MKMKLTTKSQIEFRRLELLMIATKKLRIYSSASIAATPLLCVRASAWFVVKLFVSFFNGWCPHQPFLVAKISVGGDTNR
jgi:hypothetical protein